MARLSPEQLTEPNYYSLSAITVHSQLLRSKGTHEPRSYFRAFLRSRLNVFIELLALCLRKATQPFVNQNFLLKRSYNSVLAVEGRLYKMHGISSAVVLSGDTGTRSGAVSLGVASGQSGGRSMYSGSDIIGSRVAL